MKKYLQNFNWVKLQKLTAVLILLYIVLVFGICIFKYLTYSYNALDLAIFNQVFYNSSLGNFFHFTIHPTSYLGDHFELIIFFLIPFYALLKSPLTLLFIQTIFLALTAVPLYLIAKKYLNPWPTLLVIILYLFNPVTWNINLFEFHILALAPFFIAWAFYFYDQNKFKPWLFFSLACLIVREDIAFVIFMFGILAILDKKKLAWILTPLLLAPIYFLTALKIVGYFSAAKSYKFLVYYQWLGETPLEMLKNFFWKFPLVLQHVFTLPNFELILGFFLVFLFLPFLRPKYLLLALGMFSQIILGFASGELILRTHYGAIFLIACAISTIFALNYLKQNSKFMQSYLKHAELIICLVAACLLYIFLVIGPIPSFVYYVYATDYRQVALKNEFVSQIPPTASIVTTYDLIPNLSSREKVYSLNYLFLGKQQYAAGDYIIPDNTDYMLINFYDFVTFNIQYEEKTGKYYYQGDKNLLKVITEKNWHLIKVKDNLALWGKTQPVQEFNLWQELDQLPEINHPLKKTSEAGLHFLGFNQTNNLTTLYLQTTKKLDKNYFIQLNNKLYPLGFGLYPTSVWPANKVIALNFWDLAKIEQIKLLNFRGGIEMTGLGSVQEVFDKVEILAEISLN